MYLIYHSPKSLCKPCTLNKIKLTEIIYFLSPTNNIKCIRVNVELNLLSAKSFLRCFILFYDNSRSFGLWLLKIFSWPFGPARYLELYLWVSQIFIAGPDGQNKIPSWPKGPAKDLEQSEAAHDLLWPEATTS